MRSTIFLLVLAAALCLAPAALADEAPALSAPDAESQAPAALSEGDLCEAPIASPGDVALMGSSPWDPPDYILCSCQFCRTHPQTVCRISPTGYSIVCKDYYNLNC